MNHISPNIDAKNRNIDLTVSDRPSLKIIVKYRKKFNSNSFPELKLSSLAQLKNFDKCNYLAPLILFLICAEVNDPFIFVRCFLEM